MTGDMMIVCTVCVVRSYVDATHRQGDGSTWNHGSYMERQADGPLSRRCARAAVRAEYAPVAVAVLKFLSSRWPMAETAPIAAQYLWLRQAL